MRRYLLLAAMMGFGGVPGRSSAAVVESYENGLGYVSNDGSAGAPTIEESTAWATEGTKSAKFTLNANWNWIWNYHDVLPSVADVAANQYFAFDFKVASGQFKMAGIGGNGDGGWRQQDAWNNFYPQPGGDLQLLPLPAWTSGENRGYGVFVAGDTGTFVWDYKAAGFNPTEFNAWATFQIVLQGPSGSVIHFDNLRVLGGPPQPPKYVESTIFSWETPDNPATPGVDERFEGWESSFSTDHVHAISTLGATDGTHALQIDRTGLGSGFTWGSQVEYAGGTGNPAGQADINNLVNLINGAHAIAFDVAFDDFLASPTWTKFGVHLTDQRPGDVFSFFQAEGSFIDGLPEPGTTYQVQIPLSAFTDASAAKLGTLAAVGLDPATEFLRLGLSVNTDGGGLYQIDNLRIVREAAPLAGDFNNDGQVDAVDFVQWQGAFGGASGRQGKDLLAWQREFGTVLSNSVATATVPEPASLALAALGLLARGRRRRT